jgi:hypothetical protein
MGFNKTLVVRVDFISQMALAAGKKMDSQHSVVNHVIGFYGLGLLARFFA